MGDMANPYEDFLGLRVNSTSTIDCLWHEEDIARSPDLGDVRIAVAKRAIDQANQKRNDAIERMDNAIEKLIHERKRRCQRPT